MAIFVPNSPLAGFNIGTGSLQGPTVILDDLTGVSTSTFLIAGGAVGDQFFISASNFNVKANGNITASNALLSGTITATAGEIGGWTIGSTTLAKNGVTLDSANGQIRTADNFVNGDGFFLGSGASNNFRVGLAGGSRLQFTGANIEIYSSNNKVVSLGTVNEIAGFGLTPTAISSSNNNLVLRSDGQITGSSVLFDGGRIGGFTVDSSKITGTNIIIDSAGSLQTTDYASDLKGWKISAIDNGYAEFENVRIRGTLKTAVFEKETVNAVGGQLYVANSTTITGSEASSSIPDVLYLKFGGYSGSNAIQNIVGSNNSYLVIQNLATASIQNIPATTETYRPIGGTGLQILSGSKGSSTTLMPASITGINLGTSASFTVAMWVRPDFSGLTTTAPTGSIIEKSGSSGLNGPLFIGWTLSAVGSTTASIRTSTSNNTTSTLRTNAATNDILYSGQWNHIAMTVSASNGSLTRTVYKNGQNLDQLTATPSSNQSFFYFTAPNTAPINIGAGRQYQDRFPGIIADVRIYSRSLSSNEIQTIYSGSYITASIGATTPALQVDNVTGFVNGEILSAKKISNTGFATEYVQVRDTARFNPSSDTDYSGMLYVTRSYGNNVAGDSSSLGGTPSNGQSYEPSQVIVSTGKINTGFIRINANPNDSATPYIDIVERTGSGIYDVQLKARLGDLSGLANSSYVLGSSEPGFGLATDNVFLQGGIVANFGTIGGFNITRNAITGSSFFISGSAVGDELFISSSAFNVKANGNVTGSSMLFNGGRVGNFIVTSSKLTSPANFTGFSSVPRLDISSLGVITGSNILIRQEYITSYNNDLPVYTLYEFINTNTGVINARNIGRQIVADRTEYSRVSSVDDGLNSSAGNYFNFSTPIEYTFVPLPGETHALINFTAKAMTAQAPNSSQHVFSLGVFRYFAKTGSSAGTTSTAFDNYDQWVQEASTGNQYSYKSIISLTSTAAAKSGSIWTSDQDDTSIIVPLTEGTISDPQKPMKIQIKANHNLTTTMRSELYVKNITVTLTSKLGVDLIKNTVAQASAPTIQLP